MTLEGPHNFHRSRFLPLLTVVSNFHQAEEDARDNHHCAEYFSYIGQSL